MSLKQISNLRQYFLNPKGIIIPKPKEYQKIQFIDWGLTLHRPEKKVEKNVVTFKLKPYKYSLQKPEIKQYLEKIYGLNVTKVHTLNYMGKIARNHKSGRYRQSDHKKVYVELNEDIDPFFQSIK
ncbi:hypothetical protein pb186bvf_007585 [Paramecium bursaria]